MAVFTTQILDDFTDPQCSYIHGRNEDNGTNFVVLTDDPSMMGYHFFWSNADAEHDDVGVADGRARPHSTYCDSDLPEDSRWYPEVSFPIPYGAGVLKAGDSMFVAIDVYAPLCGPKFGVGQYPEIHALVQFIFSIPGYPDGVYVATLMGNGDNLGQVILGETNPFPVRLGLKAYATASLTPVLVLELYVNTVLQITMNPYAVQGISIPGFYIDENGPQSLDNAEIIYIRNNDPTISDLHAGISRHDENTSRVWYTRTN